jgi:hypothetical protein
MKSYMLPELIVITHSEIKFHTIHKNIARLWGPPTHPPIQCVPGALSLVVMRPGREADHLPPSSAEVKNAWSYTSTPPICLNGVVLKLKNFIPLPYLRAKETQVTQYAC